MTASSIGFLPGTSGAGAFWDPIRTRLGTDRPTWTLDWPGLGGNRSDPTVDSFDDLVDWTIERLDGPTLLVGQSMGGYVAMRIAIDRPDLVSGLVLAVTSGGIDRGALGLPDWRPAVGEGDAPWVAAQLAPLDAAIPSVRVPTLLVWASGDPISPLPLGRRLAELLPDAELVVFESDDHWVVLEHADEVTARIDRLAERC